MDVPLVPQARPSGATSDAEPTATLTDEAAAGNRRRCADPAPALGTAPPRKQSRTAAQEPEGLGSPSAGVAVASALGSGLDEMVSAGLSGVNLHLIFDSFRAEGERYAVPAPQVDEQEQRGLEHGLPQIEPRSVWPSTHPLWDEQRQMPLLDALDDIGVEPLPDVRDMLLDADRLEQVAQRLYGDAESPVWAVNASGPGAAPAEIDGHAMSTSAVAAQNPTLELRDSPGLPLTLNQVIEIARHQGDQKARQVAQALRDDAAVYTPLDVEVLSNRDGDAEALQAFQNMASTLGGGQAAGSAGEQAAAGSADSGRQMLEAFHASLATLRDPQGLGLTNEQLVLIAKNQDVQSALGTIKDLLTLLSHPAGVQLTPQQVVALATDENLKNAQKNVQTLLASLRN